MNFPDKWLKKVSDRTGMSQVDVKTNITRWWNRGCSLDYIKQVLIMRANLNGKTLHFVSRHGKN